MRARSAWVLAAATVAAAISIAVVPWRGDDRTPSPGYRNGDAIAPLDSAALRDLPWAADAAQEMGDAGSGMVYTPFVGASLRDYSGTFVNVSNRVRRSYAASSLEAEPVEVWFFGGSTMFGFDLLRDEHTIPSEIVRLAEAEGIHVRARNFGAPGLVNFQEVVLLTQLLAAGERPDAVVFYDGINDKSLGLLKGLGLGDPQGEPSALGAYELRRVLAPVVPGGTPDPPSPLLDSTRATRFEVGAMTDDITDVYGQGVQLARTLAAQYGFPVRFYWQPDLYSRTPLDPGEEELLPGLGLDGDRIEEMRRFSRDVRDSLPEGVVDLSDALDEVAGPVLVDVVHINETGARAVAEHLYPSLRDDLRPAPAG